MEKNNKKEKKEKEIRRLLLLISDKEMQNKIKKKNPVLINSMTPLELENSFQLYKNIINTTESTYTNILEKHIVEHVVDIHNNINYYYSDSIDKKKRRKINKKYYKLKGVYSAKYFDSNFGDFVDDEEESEEKEEDEKEEIIKNIIPFINKKKNVGEGKIIKDKSYSIISPKNNYNNKQDINNNICIDSSSDFNTNNRHQCEKQKNQQNILDINYKLIYYCYTNLKRKRPLIIQKDDNEAVCGLEIEEYFNQIMRSSTFKKKKVNNNLPINKMRSKSTKNINRKKVKKNKYLKNLKDINKKNRGCVANRNRNYNNHHSNNFNSELSNLKSKIQKYKSLKIEKKSKIRRNRLSQDNKTEKYRTNSLAKKHKTIFSNDNKKINIRESPFHNIISKKDNKKSIFDDNSPFIENKNKINSKRKEIKANSKNKEKVKDSKENGKSKFIPHSKLKHQCLEEIKVGNNKPNKKSLKEPIRAQFINSLQKKVGFNFNFEENKKNFYKNQKASSKTSLINKKKSKSKKDCIVYDDNSDSEEDEQYSKKRKLSYGLKDKNNNFIHSKKNNSINKKRKFS